MKHFFLKLLGINDIKDTCLEFAAKLEALRNYKQYFDNLVLTEEKRLHEENYKKILCDIKEDINTYLLSFTI